MPNPRQPIDSEREDISKGRLDDSATREAGSFEMEDEEPDDTLNEDDDMDY